MKWPCLLQKLHIFLHATTQIYHAIAWMSGPKIIVEAHLLSSPSFGFKRTNLGHLEKGVRGGKEGVPLAAKREAPMVSKLESTTLFGGRKKIEEAEQDLKRRLTFHLPYRLFLLLFMFSLFSLVSFLLSMS